MSPGRSATSGFERFLVARRGDLKRIAARTQGELSADDLASEAWLIAIEIGVKRDWPFDFDDEDDQDTLFAWMHNRFVKYADKAVRFAVKLDRDWEDESGESMGSALARLLTGPLDSDPQVRRQLHEERDDLLAIVRYSYSEAAAYLLLLMRLDWHMEDLAALLWISVGAARQRLRVSGLRARVQPSLFDGIETIDPDFIAWRRVRGARRFVEPAEAVQLPLVV